MKKLKLLYYFIKYKLEGLPKEQRYFKYVIKRLITFEQYDNFRDKIILNKEEEEWKK